MDLAEKVKKAFQKAIAHEGNMLKLSEKAKVNYAAINRYHNGKNDFKNMPLHTLESIFPEIEISFFKDEQSEAQSYSSESYENDKVRFEIEKILDALDEADRAGCLALIASTFGTAEQIKARLKRVVDAG